MVKENLQKKMERPPVVCIMGHIDHGKSTLLDYIRKTNIVDKEKGGITQKISAYEVIHNNKKITFLDTPGHESFSKIRQRGANVADIAILVVSAEDGVKKQTIEAINCIKESGTPLIIAINKIDKPGANIEKTKISLAENEVYLEGYGGQIPFVPISAKTGEGVDDLLDLMLLVAEVEELSGDPSINAEGIVIEANMDKQKGISATLIIQAGTLRTGMFIACGKSLAPTRIVEDFTGKKITEATFSSPIRIIGFDILPQVGTKFVTFNDKESALNYISLYKEPVLKKCVFVDETEIEEGIGFIDIVIKADVMGSIEGIQHELEKIRNDRMKVNIISSGVGDISENDINLLGGKTDSIVLGFNVKVDSKAQAAAEKSGIQIKTFDIIYKLAEWLEEIAIARVPKIDSEEISGRAKVLKFFSSVKDRSLIGARVEEGEIRVGDQIKIFRQEAEIGRGEIKELQQSKEKTSEVRTGLEFGCQLKSSVVPAAGDKLESVRIIKK